MWVSLWTPPPSPENSHTILKRTTKSMRLIEKRGEIHEPLFWGGLTLKGTRGLQVGRQREAKPQKLNPKMPPDPQGWVCFELISTSTPGHQMPGHNPAQGTDTPQMLSKQGLHPPPQRRQKRLQKPRVGGRDGLAAQRLLLAPPAPSSPPRMPQSLSRVQLLSWPTLQPPGRGLAELAARGGLQLATAQARPRKVTGSRAGWERCPLPGCQPV